MRIISGIYKGKRLNPGKHFSARPTTDFAKENIFNVLHNYFDFESLQVLDLFSGTGSISYEFASRGCKSVESVESNSRHHKYIHKTSKELGLDNLVPIKADAFRFLKHTHRSYDLIFADPPFDMKGIDHLPEIIFSRNLLNDRGWFILEHGRGHDFSDHVKFREVRKYGSVHFSILTG